MWKVQISGSLEQIGQQKCPLAWHLVQETDVTSVFVGLALKDCCWTPPPTRLKLNCPSRPPSSIKPDPLHLEQAINLTSPHLLHIPTELQNKPHEFIYYTAKSLHPFSNIYTSMIIHPSLKILLNTFCRMYNVVNRIQNSEFRIQSIRLKLLRKYSNLCVQ